jgi:diguanylate cyclase (GGDEF)-like protein
MPRRPSAADVLNALTAHIAVLDRDAGIVLVNDAWRRFASENGGPSGAFVGDNYLAVCEQSLAADHDVTAEESFRNLQALIRGAIESFSLEYPCNSSAEERWFCLRATRASGPDHAFVLSHEDITARKMIERELEQILEREKTLARTDELTGALNRRQFFELAVHEHAVTKRYKQSLAVILFDIDHFKRFNDAAGHMVGDEVLRKMADLVRRHLRDADLFARYGGEEFILLLPRTTAVQAVTVAERIRQELHGHAWMTTEGPLVLTISSGIAELEPGDDSIEPVIRRADGAMYEAKEQGRNRTVLSPSASQCLVAPSS